MTYVVLAWFDPYFSAKKFSFRFSESGWKPKNLKFFIGVRVTPRSIQSNWLEPELFLIFAN